MPECTYTWLRENCSPKIQKNYTKVFHEIGMGNHPLSVKSITGVEYTIAYYMADELVYFKRNGNTIVILNTGSMKDALAFFLHVDNWLEDVTLVNSLLAYIANLMPMSAMYSITRRAPHSTLLALDKHAACVRWLEDPQLEFTLLYFGGGEEHLKLEYGNGGDYYCLSDTFVWFADSYDSIHTRTSEEDEGFQLLNSTSVKLKVAAPEVEKSKKLRGRAFDALRALG